MTALRTPPPTSGPGAYPASMHAQGYMVTVEYDGDTLTAQGTNKAAHFALRGPDQLTDPDDYAGPVRIPRAAMAGVTFKDATPLVNGRLTVETTDGRAYRLNFRRKQREAFRELADALGAQR